MTDRGIADEKRGRSPATSGHSNGPVHPEGKDLALDSADKASRPTSIIVSSLNVEPKEPVQNDQITPKFPPLHNNTPSHIDGDQRAATKYSVTGEDIGDDPGVAEPFERILSPTSDLERNKGAIYEKVGDQGVCKMHKVSLYETATRYYVVGADVTDRRFRILKIDRTVEVGNLCIAEDEIVYTKKEMGQLLNAIDDGNKSTGGMKLKCSTWGLLGFIRFTGPYYMLLVTKRSQVAMIGGHYVYQIDGTELVPLIATHNSKIKPDVRNTEESRFLGILNNLDLSRSFYFSYSYDITRTLQHNIIREREALSQGVSYPRPPDYNAMFVWNNYLLQPAAQILKNPYDWCLPVVHGYIDQAGTLQERIVRRSWLTISSAINIWKSSSYHHNCKTVPIFCWCSVPKAWC
jgi:phosphatidylinositol 3,5-bisphosphate 5-phosphatase